MSTIYMDGQCHKKIHVDGFKWKNKKFIFTQKFIQNYHDDSNKGYIREVDVSYPKRQRKIRYGLPFSPERIKICMTRKNAHKIPFMSTHKIPKDGFGLWADTRKSA